MKETSKTSWYDKKKTAERLYLLRSEYEDKIGKKISALQLVKHIKEKTGIEIGGNTYNKHENFSNDTNMSIELLVALAKFYEVSYDYILGFSDTRYPQRENFHNKYGLDDAALDRIESIYHLQKSQVKNEPDLPTDMDIINALFQCEEFQSLVENIRTSYKVRSAAAGLYSDTQKNQKKFLASLDDKQKELAKNGALSILSASEANSYSYFQMQLSMQQLVKELMENLY